MKILVTGATGLLGRQLSTELLAEGHQLLIVGRSNEDRFRQRFTLPCDYLSWEQLEKMPEVDAIIHLAGDPIADGRWSAQKKQRILDSRVKTTESLVKACENSGHWPKTLISASAIGYYGDRSDQWLKEDAAPDEGFLADVCQQWEDASKAFDAHSRRALLRIGIIMDPRGGFLTKMDSIFSSGLGGRIGNGQQWMSWIHSEDMVGIILHALNDEKAVGAINSVSPQPVTNSEFTNTYAKQIGVMAPFPAPEFAVSLAMGEMSQLATNSQRISAEKIEQLGYRFKHPNLGDALKDLYSWRERTNQKLFEVQQWIPHPMNEVFQFFSEAKNLERITPKWLNFRITGQSTDAIQEGTLIDYKLNLHGVPVSWRTEIQSWDPPRQFVDTQLKGPYQHWHHTHHFRELAGGTLMTDRVIYQLPLGRLGSWVAGGFVNNDVRQIFDYRHEVISQLQFQAIQT